MEKKNNKGLVVIIVILVLLVLGLGGYIIYDKFMSDDKIANEGETKVEEKAEKEEAEDLSLVSTSLIQKIVDYNIDQLDAYEKNFTVTETPNNEQLQAMFDYFWDNGNGTPQTITQSSVSTYFKNVYGMELSSYPDIICNICNLVLYTYDNTKEAYVLTGNHGHDGNHVSAFIHKAYDIQKNSDEYVITLNKVYGVDMMRGKSGFYSDAKRNNKITDLDQFINKDTGEGDNDSALNYYNTNYESLKETSPKYKYTFKKNEIGEFYLTKYEVIK